MEAEVVPRISLVQVSVKRTGVMVCWSVGWRIENRGTQPLTILSVRLPHGQFKSEEQHFDPAIILNEREWNVFQIAVRCDEPAGRVTENAFLIFHAAWLGEPWRIFVRVRVEVGSNGEPKTVVELITTQKIGFSGVTA